MVVLIYSVRCVFGRRPVLSNLNRMSSQVGKELLICNLLVPPDVTRWNCPTVLERCKVQQVLLRRWIPEKTRFAHDDAANA